MLRSDILNSFHVRDPESTRILSTPSQFKTKIKLYFISSYVWLIDVRPTVWLILMFGWSMGLLFGWYICLVDGFYFLVDWFRYFVVILGASEHFLFSLFLELIHFKWTLSAIYWWLNEVKRVILLYNFDIATIGLYKLSLKSSRVRYDTVYTIGFIKIT